jgi:hypothetical protein
LMHAGRGMTESAAIDIYRRILRWVYGLLASIAPIAVGGESVLTKIIAGAQTRPSTLRSTDQIREPTCAGSISWCPA